MLQRALLAAALILAVANAAFSQAAPPSKQTLGLIYRGWALDAEGRFAEALKILDQAVAADPKAPGAWSYRGFALFGLQRYQEALESANKALALDDRMTSAWKVRGFAYHHLGRYQEAVASFERVQALDPKDSGATRFRQLSAQQAASGAPTGPSMTSSVSGSWAFNCENEWSGIVTLEQQPGGTVTGYYTNQTRNGAPAPQGTQVLNGNFASSTLTFVRPFSDGTKQTYLLKLAPDGNSLSGTFTGLGDMGHPRTFSMQRVKSLPPASAQGSSGDPVVGLWTWVNQEPVELTTSGEIRLRGDRKGTWRRQGISTYVLSWLTGGVDTLTLSGNRMDGSNQTGQPIHVNRMMTR